jgi:hypothetical protein
VKDKRNVRYLVFRSATDGGRVFDFSVTVAESPNLLTSFEIPAHLFSGDGRIRLQEGVGICYAKLKHLLENGASTDVPSTLCLTASDLAQYREVPSRPSKTRNAAPAPESDWDENRSRKTS